MSAILLNLLCVNNLYTLARFWHVLLQKDFLYEKSFYYNHCRMYCVYECACAGNDNG